MLVKKSDFHFDLPPGLIAQQPLQRRSASRLLVADAAANTLEDRQFGELPDCLRPGDLLVFNHTRVLPARLFGRKETGDTQLFGILGRGKKQIAYSKVSLNVVDVTTSRIVYAVQGAGEYELGSREVLGTGGSQGYDSTLNGKVLNFSITDAVNKLVRDLESGQLKLQ